MKNKYLSKLKNINTNFNGKTVVITGSNSGIGFYAARFIASTKAKIVMACRNQEKAEVAKSKILTSYPSANIDTMQLDLSSLKSIASFVEDFAKKHKRADVLINNAGLYYPANKTTADNLEMTIGTNFIGTYYLTNLMKSKMATNGRIIIVTSLTDKNSKFVPNDFFNLKGNRNSSYGRSKLYLSAYSHYLSKSLTKNNRKNIKLISVHPGVSATNILNPNKTGFSKGFAAAGNLVLKLFTHCPEKASLGLVYASLGKQIANGDRIAPRGIFEISGYPKKSKYPQNAIEIENAVANMAQETLNSLGITTN